MISSRFQLFKRINYLNYFKIQTSSSTSTSTNELLKELAKQIQFNGPITVNDYMRYSLTHPKYGFYMQKDVFGQKGHFITSPEISQIFGELIAIWIMYQWQQYSSQKQLDIIELGPGRGTLSVDIARSFSQFLSLRQNLHCRFHLIEISSYLQSIQHKNLCNNNSIESIKNDVKLSKTIYNQSIYWYQSIDQFKLFNSDDNNNDSFSIFIANEFFDAFPIHKFMRNDEYHKWNELLIDYDEQKQCLRWIKSKNETPMIKLLTINGYFDRINQSTKHVEYSPMINIVIDKIIDYIQNKQSSITINDLKTSILGSILICDYGFDIYNDDNNIIDRDTFRCYYQHKQCDPLLNPGLADLTADIDFNEIRYSIQLNKKNVHCFGAIEQRKFLQQMGIEFRLKQLLQQYNDNINIQNELIDSIMMLMDEEQMGKRFKFMSIFISNNNGGGKIFSNNEKPVGFL